jgi:mRNA interferase RelE/StbE
VTQGDAKNRSLNFSRSALKFLVNLDAKQFKQVAAKSLMLGANATPADCRKLKGCDYYRVDVGEFRIAYWYDDSIVYVVAIGKRNDDEVYRGL